MILNIKSLPFIKLNLYYKNCVIYIWVVATSISEIMLIEKHSFDVYLVKLIIFIFMLHITIRVINSETFHRLLSEMKNPVFVEHRTMLQSRTINDLVVSFWKRYNHLFWESYFHFERISTHMSYQKAINLKLFYFQWNLFFAFPGANCTNYYSGHRGITQYFKLVGQGPLNFF